MGSSVGFRNWTRHNELGLGTLGWDGYVVVSGLPVTGNHGNNGDDAKQSKTLFNPFQIIAL
jgi:hypothetical protein